MPKTDDEPQAVADRGLVLLGRIAGAHGLKGEVKVNSFTQVPENIAAYGPLGDGKGRVFVVESLRPLKGTVVAVQFAGVHNRTDAESLKGTELYAERTKLPELDEDEWYHADLIGLAAISPENEEIGQVIAVQNFGAGDLLEIKQPGEPRSLIVPFTKMAVPVVDVKNRRVVVIIPEEEEAQDDEQP
jgi:16S rRNA processing protein RimM